MWRGIRRRVLWRAGRSLCIVLVSVMRSLVRSRDMMLTFSFLLRKYRWPVLDPISRSQRPLPARLAGYYRQLCGLGLRCGDSVRDVEAGECAEGRLGDGREGGREACV